MSVNDSIHKVQRTIGLLCMWRCSRNPELVRATPLYSQCAKHPFWPLVSKYYEYTPFYFSLKKERFVHIKRISVPTERSERQRNYGVALTPLVPEREKNDIFHLGFKIYMNWSIKNKILVQVSPWFLTSRAARQILNGANIKETDLLIRSRSLHLFKLRKVTHRFLSP